MNFFVVQTESMRWLAVKRDWVQNPILKKRSLVFLSPNPNEIADFKIQSSFYINQHENSVYESFVWPEFGKYFFAIFL